MLHFRMDMPFYLMSFYGSIMVVLVVFLRAFLKNRLPKFVFPALWCMVLLRLLVPFAISSPLSLPMVPGNLFGDSVMFYEEAIAQDTMAENPDEPLVGSILDRRIITNANVSNAAEYTRNGDAAVISVEAQGGVSEEIFPVSVRWQNFVLAIYLIGAAATAGILGWRKHCCSEKLKNGLLMENNEMVNSMLHSMDMKHVLVFTSDEIASPMVSGLLNPRIYLPAGMNFQDKALLGNIIAHEAMHIRRRDNWVKAVMLIVLCVNWYNPLIWLMSKCLSADLEAACDEAVLKKCGEEGRKEYARSLLAMAVTGGRTTLLYSAFSKTEVERRIKGVLGYKKITAFALVFSVLFMAGSAIVFATSGQAPFSARLTSYCAGAYSRWGVRVSVTRDLALGKDAEERAENVIFAVLRADETEDPEIIEAQLLKELAGEFGVEQRAFAIDISLCLSQEEIEEEYARWNITKGEDGFWSYQKEKIRVYQDKMLGSVQSREDGDVDIMVERDKLGRIVAVTVLRQGDEEFDRRTREIEKRQKIMPY